jgi:hypothetical protein
MIGGCMEEKPIRAWMVLFVFSRIGSGEIKRPISRTVVATDVADAAPKVLKILQRSVRRLRGRRRLSVTVLAAPYSFRDGKNILEGSEMLRLREDCPKSVAWLLRAKNSSKIFSVGYGEACKPLENS